MTAMQRITGNTIERWHFDRGSGGYVTDDGAKLSAEDVRRAVDDVIAGAKQEAVGLTEQMRDKRLNVDQWRNSMTALLIALHTACAKAGNGNSPAVALIAEADLQATIANETSYLRNFADAIRLALAGGLGLSLLAGLQREPANLAPMWSGRAASYMDAGRVTYERQRYLLHVALGYSHGRRVVNPIAESCLGCLEQERLGWRPIAEVPPLGHEQCGQWCQCEIQYDLSRNRSEAV